MINCFPSPLHALAMLGPVGFGFVTGKQDENSDVFPFSSVAVE